MTQWIAPVALAMSLALAAPASAADLIIKTPDEHPDYVVELEPHGLFIFGYTVGRLYAGQNGDIGFGPGFRANFRILKNGFLPKLNNNVAIGVGAELAFDTFNNVRLITPVVLQWNFWLTSHWSVFGEPGIAIEFPMSTPNGPEPIYFGPYLAVGARFAFNERIALTMRLGYPISSIGVSFFL